MGLFDSVLEGIAGRVVSQEAAAHPLVGTLGSLLDQNGGLQGLQQKFAQNGLESTFTSWVSSEAGQAISPQEIEQVLGSGQIAQVAQKLGIDPSTASSFLSQHLPEVVSQLTPNGQIDPNQNHHEALASLLPSLLQGLEAKAQA
jgi:uncharacterized protein YidB (DUF937 family)